eukprot:scaffold99396_cov42-Phaeocystis_antarctica.AAC.1
MNGSAKRTRVDADELVDLRAQLFAHLTTLLAADPEADGNPARLKVPQLGSCASSGRTWRLWAARCLQGEARPLGAQPLPPCSRPTPRLTVQPASPDWLAIWPGL